MSESTTNLELLHQQFIEIADREKAVKQTHLHSMMERVLVVVG